MEPLFNLERAPADTTLATQRRRKIYEKYDKVMAFRYEKTYLVFKKNLCCATEPALAYCGTNYIHETLTSIACIET